jgi:phosphatidylinositol N-acetylglucosaminyltransferase subunit Q
MHPFSVLTLGIFVAGYITARWDLVTRLYELAGFAWNHGVVVRFYHIHLLLRENYGAADTCSNQTRAAKGFAVLSIFFFLFIIPIERFAARETSLVMMHLSTPQISSSQEASTLAP